MKFTINKNVLKNVMSKMSKVSPSKATSNSLLNVKIEVNDDEISFSATDNDIFIKEYIDAEIKEDGVALLPCKRLFNIVNGLIGDDVSFRINDDKASICCGGSKFNLTCFDGDIFEPEIDTKDKTSISADDFISGINNVSSCSASNEDKYTLSGVNIDNGCFAATDTFRMAIYNIDGCDVSCGLIPAKSLSKIKGSLSGDLLCYNSESYAKICNEKTIIYLRKIEGKFPEYKNVIPKENNIKLKVNKTDLLNAVNQASNTIDENTSSITLRIYNNYINVISCFAGCDSLIEIPCKSDKEMTICFNYLYILDMISKIEGEGITINLKNDSSPALIIEDYLTYIISPVMGIYSDAD